MIVETRNITDKTAEQVFYDKRFLKDLLNNNEYVQIFWLPFTGKVFLPPARKLGQGNVFTGVCHSVHRGGCASVHAGIPPGTSPPGPGPPGADPPQPGTPQQQTPRSRACWEIRSTNGRYASYWNAILLCLQPFCFACMNHKRSPLG